MSILVPAYNLERWIADSLESAIGTRTTASNLSTYEAVAWSSNPMFASVVSLPSGFTGQYGLDSHQIATDCPFSLVHRLLTRVLY